MSNPEKLNQLAKDYYGETFGLKGYTFLLLASSITALGGAIKDSDPAVIVGAVLAALFISAIIYATWRRHSLEKEAMDYGTPEEFQQAVSALNYEKWVGREPISPSLT